MGAAAYNRGNALIARQCAANAPKPDAILLDALNAEPKRPGAPKPFGPVHFIAGNGGWWAECPKTGFGYWHTSLRAAVRSLRVAIVTVQIRQGSPVYVGVPL